MSKPDRTTERSALCASLIAAGLAACFPPAAPCLLALAALAALVAFTKEDNQQ